MVTVQLTYHTSLLKLTDGEIVLRVNQDSTLLIMLLLTLELELIITLEMMQTVV